MNYSVDSLWFEFYKIIFFKEGKWKLSRIGKKNTTLCSLSGPSPGTAPSPQLWGLRHMTLTFSFLIAPGNMYSTFHAPHRLMKRLPKHQEALHWSQQEGRGGGGGLSLTVLEFAWATMGRSLCHRRENLLLPHLHLWHCPEAHMEGA